MKVKNFLALVSAVSVVVFSAPAQAGGKKHQPAPQHNTNVEVQKNYQSQHQNQSQNAVGVGVGKGGDGGNAQTTTKVGGQKTGVDVKTGSSNGGGANVSFGGDGSTLYFPNPVGHAAPPTACLGSNTFSLNGIGENSVAATETNHSSTSLYVAGWGGGNCKPLPVITKEAELNGAALRGQLKPKVITVEVEKKTTVNINKPQKSPSGAH